MQAYAMQTVFERLGHKAVVIDYYSNETARIRSPWYKDVFSYPIRFIRKYILRDEKVIIRAESYYRYSFSGLSKFVAPFVNKHIKRVVFDSLSSIREEDFDLISVGSDQIWRGDDQRKKCITDVFLAFTKGWNIKRMSYAASFGTDIWNMPAKETFICTESLKMFNAVSVREESGVGLCRKIFGVCATHVLDPSLLLEKEDYMGLIKDWEGEAHPTGSIMTYILDKSEGTSEIVREIAKKSGLTPFETCGSKEVRVQGNKYLSNGPIEDWLSGFRDAELIVTDSFHACVFSIIFRKPFLVIQNKERGTARIESLLKMFHLRHNLIDSADQFVSLNDYAITTEAVAALYEWRSKSWAFLKKNTV